MNKKKSRFVIPSVIHLPRRSAATLWGINPPLSVLSALITAVMIIGVLGFGENVKAQCVDEVDGCLYGWNQEGAGGANWPDWTWKDDAAYGHPGWWKDDGKFFSGNWLPRSMAVDGYGTKESGLIDTTDRAPSTNSGACLKAYDTGEVENYQANWWVLLGDGPLYLRNLTNADTDRMSFYLKTEGMVPIPESAGKFPNFNFHIGTYLCWGDSIPLAQEGPENQHYYHHLVIDSGTWLHVLMDQHPMHRRGVHGSVTPHNDPRWEDSGVHYFEHLLTFYMEIRNSQPNLTSYKVDEIKFYSTKDTYEPNQNDISISTPWIGYWQDGDYWEMGWQDGSWYDGTNDYTESTFDVRWSISPITNENFGSANKINPELFAVNGTNLVRRPNTWSRTAWTRFKLPDEIEQNYNHLYFAIKDVSINGGHVGPWPYHHGDGHDAPSSLIHTIDYYLTPDGPDTTPPSRSNPQPTGTLSSGTTSTTISLDTNETAVCKYSANSGTNYDLMENTFTNTNSTSHSTTVSNLSDGNSYTYYIRCQDESNNQNPDDFEISFSIASSATYSISNFINLVTDWLKSESGLTSDVNGDGVVNTRDLGIMMSNWSE